VSGAVGEVVAGGIGGRRGGLAEVFGNALGNNIAGSVGNTGQQTEKLNDAPAEAATGSYWESHPMMYAANDIQDPLVPQDRLIVSFGGDGSNDLRFVPSAETKFVNEYTAQHPNASFDEAQEEYDQTWFGQSDAHLMRHGVVSPETANVRPIGEVEGFLTFSPLGQGITGFGRAARDFVPDMAQLGKQTLLTMTDAIGISVNEINKAITGSNLSFQSSGAVFQSIERNGVLATLGIGLNTVAKGVLSPIDALYRRDPGAIGENVFGTISGLGMGAATSRVGRVANGARPAYLTSAEFADLPKTGTIDPRTIRYSQSSAAAAFKPPYGTVDDFIQNLLTGGIDTAAIDPVRIVQRDGKIFSLDNRRLYSFEQAGIDIPYQKLDVIPKRELFKFTTTNDGTSIIIRKGK
jgi:hypothetical protein